MKKTNIFSILLLGLTVLAVNPAKSYATDITSLLSQHINAPFNEEVEMIKVHYAPGESSAPHRHNAHTLVYMLEGEVDMQVKGGELVRLVAGETFYESPEDIHLVSRNASTNNDAVFLVVFIKPQDAATLIPYTD